MMKQLLKKLTAALLCASMLLSALGAMAEETEISYGVCTGNQVNVRKTAAGNSVWFRVDKGHVGQILGQEEKNGDQWYKISTSHPVPNGRTYIGYIHEDYFRPMTAEELEDYLTGLETETPAPTETEGDAQPTLAPSVGDVSGEAVAYEGVTVVGATGKTTSTVNFRSQPSTQSGKILGTIKISTELEVTGVPGEGDADGWYRVVYNGQVGFVFAKYVKILESGTTVAPEVDTGTEVNGAKGEVTADGVIIYAAPATSAETLCTLSEGTEVELLTIPDQISTDNWYKVSYEEQIGYIQSNFIRVTDKGDLEEGEGGEGEEEDSPTAIVSTGSVTAADGVNFRTAPDRESTSLGKLGYETVVELLSIPEVIDEDHWYQVRYNGKTGYIQSNFLRVLTVDPSLLPEEIKYGYARLTQTVNVRLRATPGGEVVTQWYGKGSLMRITGAPVQVGIYNWYPVYHTELTSILYVRDDMIEVVYMQDGVIVTKPPEAESVYGYVITTGSSVNLRIQPGETVITEIPRNTVLTCVGESVVPEDSAYRWYHVSYNGKVGYVRGDYVRVCTSTGGEVVETPDETDDPADSTTVYGYIRLSAGTNVHLRKAPQGDSLGELPDGLILPVVGEVVPQGVSGPYAWYPVRTADGVFGYIREDVCVDCDEEGNEIIPEPEPTPTETPDLVGATGRMTNNTNFRESPSTAEGVVIITVIPAGTEITILSIPENTQTGWYKISYDGMTGYVYGKYVEVLNAGTEGDGSEEDGDESAVILGYIRVTGNNVNVRTSPGGTVVTKLQEDTVWPIVGDSMSKDGIEWFYIRVDEEKGYISSTYAVKLTQAQEDEYLGTGAVPDEITPPELIPSNHLKVTASTLNVRESYSLESTAITKVKYGTVLQFFTTKDVGTYTWYSVLCDDLELWVRGDYIEEMTQAEYDQWAEENPDLVPDMDSHRGYMRTKQANVNVRNAADGSIVITTIAKKGTVLRFYGTLVTWNGYSWYRVLTTENGYGYIRSDLIEQCDENGDDLPVPEPELGDTSSAPDSQQETTYYTLTVGSTGTKVANLVNELINQGYYAGEPTDTFTTAVQASVKAFQTVKGLSVTGTANSATQHALFGTRPIGAGNTENLEFAIYPVEKIDWYTGGIQDMIPKGTNFKIYDVKTGIVWWAHRWSGGRHADIETLTAADSARLCQIYGVSNLQEIVDENMWERRPCLVTIGTRTFACSLDGMQHNPDGDTISNNDMDGQICLHFTNSEGHSSQAVSETHAEAIEYAYNNCPAGKKE